MRIVLLGPPGTGQGTQAKRITDPYNIPHLSTGDMLRAAASAETNIGKKVKETMASGKLVPDPLVRAAVIERIAQSDARHGFVLDGFPRTISQAVTFDDLLHTEGVELDHVIELHVDDGFAKTSVFRQTASVPRFASPCFGSFANVRKGH